MQQLQLSLSQRLKKGWNRLTAPSPALKELAEQRQARLLSSLLFMLIFLGYFVTTFLPLVTGRIGFVLQDPPFYVAMVSILIIGMLYGLSRTRYYKLAALIMVCFEFLSIFTIGLLDRSSREAYILDYLIIPVLFASLFLSFRVVLTVTFISLAGLLLGFPFLAAQFGSAQVSTNQLGFSITSSIIIVVITHYRNLLEKDRRMALARSEQLYRTLAANFPNGAVLLFDRNLRHLIADGSGLNEFGFTKEQLEGKTLEAVPSQLSQLVEPLYQEVLGGKAFVTELNHANLISQVHLVPIKDEHNQVFAGMVMTQNITARKQTEEAVMAEKERLAVTLESIGDGVITTDVEGRVVLLNSVAEQLTGYAQAEAAGRFLSEIFQIRHELSGEELEHPVQKVLATKQIVALVNHTSLIRRDGSICSIADSAAPILNKANNQLLGVVLVFRDVTEKQKLEEELLKIQKLESVGVLAGGIAHDFNNILTAVIGYISLAKLLSKESDYQEAEELVELLGEAETAAFKARGLTQQLLTFAKGGFPVKRLANLKGLLEETTRFVLHGSKVVSRFETAENLWPVEIDEGQIGQVVHNLILNAVQAMLEGGVITIKAENISALKFDTGLPLLEGNYVKVSIQDEGTGITPEILSKIFDPYFTTKPRGSGLGLATCYSIINKHNGYLTVESQLSQGTTFFIYLPVAPSFNRKPCQDPLEGTKILTGNFNGGEKGKVKGRVLVVDDEVDILNLLKRTLSAYSYEVEIAAEAEQAVKLYRRALEEARGYDVVILDLTIPGSMGGEEILQHLMALNPEVKALVASGYANDPIIAHYQDYGFAGALSKPFNVNELLSQIVGLLGQPK